MRLAAITEANVAQRILACLALPTRAPAIAPSPLNIFAEHWPSSEEALPQDDAAWSDFEFDQSVPPPGKSAPDGASSLPALHLERTPIPVGAEVCLAHPRTTSKRRG
jgi:hypothetical protein